MAVLRFSTLLLVILSSFISPQTHILVEANDDWLVQAECHNAKVPATCIQCLSSDHRSHTANAAAMAIIVVGCLSNHASSLFDNMLHLASSKHGKGSAKAYEDCCRLLATAKKDLVEADEKLMHGDYDGADRLVYSAFNCAAQCHSEIDAGESHVDEVPAEVRYKMKVLEELCEAAMRMIERLH